MIGAVILAAGESSRMGQDKALLVYHGETFLSHILTTVRVAAIDCAVVAVASMDSKIISDSMLPNEVFVLNDGGTAAGPIGSIRAAVTFFVNQMVDYLLVWPVDHPRVTAKTVSMLINRATATKAAITVPVFEGRRGHPVLFSRAVFPELLSAAADKGADAVVHLNPSRVLEVPVEDPAVVENIDAQEAYRLLLTQEK